MKKSVHVVLVLAALLLSALFLLGGCTADGEEAGEDAVFPNKPVTIIACRPPGSSNDTTARLFQPYFQKYLGQNIIVGNVAGAAGKIALTEVFRADPDGYTLVIANFPSFVLVEGIEGGVDYEMSDFEPICNVQGGETNVISVSPDGPFDTLDDLVKEAKKKPGQLTVAVTSGISNSQLALAMIQDAMGIELEMVPYEGGNECVQAAMGGHVDCVLGSSESVYSIVKEGKLKVLVACSPERLEALPDVPTLTEISGDEKHSFTAFCGLLATPGVPQEILKILEEAAVKALNDPEFVESVGDTFKVTPMDSAGLKDAIKSSYELLEEYRPLLEKFNK